MKQIEHGCFECKSSTRIYPFPKCMNPEKHAEIMSGVDALVKKTAKNKLEYKRLTAEWAYQCRMNLDKDCKYWAPRSIWQSFLIKWNDSLLIKTMKDGYWISALVAGVIIIFLLVIIIGNK